MYTDVLQIAAWPDATKIRTLGALCQLMAGLQCGLYGHVRFSCKGYCSKLSTPPLRCMRQWRGLGVHPGMVHCAALQW